MRTLAARAYSSITALLGPTNTGKTHRAIGRMLEHETGMLGLPLRLLAREVYDRLTQEVGQESVALVTGEEKRIGRRARYWVCTVEAMPLTQEVDFLGVDEIQLAAHPERGHVFTDRLLRARGREETWFLGADTMRRVICQLVPTANVRAQPRLSTLKGRGQQSLGSLPTRSAVVAFSTPEVYRIAERIRHRKGGAAVVLGALSPRARNAQVALYESGEVDYLVATDAIGMGLNLSVRHVAFAGLRKFDGRQQRELRPAELAQIAGRAGRHLEDGSFGTLSPVPALPEGLRRTIEEHRFESVSRLIWRNHNLCLQSVPRLIESLEETPTRPQLTRVARCTDLDALLALRGDPDVMARAQGAVNVESLWKTCQIPDYRKWLPQLHAELVKDVFMQVTGPSAALSDDWLAEKMVALNNTQGDIDALTARIASARTWTYLCNHSAWVADVPYWKARANELENRLSDALHDKLVERFVARRKTIASGGGADSATAQASGSELAHPFAALMDLRRELSPRPEEPSFESWVEDLCSAPHQRFMLDETGHVSDGFRDLGRLAAGSDLLRPEVRLEVDPLSAGQRLRLSRRLLAWSRDLIDEVIGGLRRKPREPWSPAARGLLYQLEQNLGSMGAGAARPQLRALTFLDREMLAAANVKLGRDVVYYTESLKPKQRKTRAALAQAHAPVSPALLAAVTAKLSSPKPAALQEGWLTTIGYVVLGDCAVRADVAHRVSQRLRQLARHSPFAPPSELAQWLGCDQAQAARITQALGYRQDATGHLRTPRRRRRKRKPRNSVNTR
jgi:ATP-dependent RNA helicase SUPV3L1/SUV3